jgi:RNA polymerase sigma-70 factor (ECF subfamily)
MALSTPVLDEQPAALSQRVADLIPALRAFARTFTLNATDGDDLVQETLFRALRSISSFQDGTSLKSWLFTIMRNTYYTQYKKKVREGPGAQECVSLRLVVSADQEWSVAESELKAALSRISDDHRQILVMVAGLGFSYEEAAAVQGCAVGTIKSRLNRAREALAREMGGNPLTT